MDNLDVGFELCLAICWFYFAFLNVQKLKGDNYEM